jgi:hypothetical protein
MLWGDWEEEGVEVARKWKWKWRWMRRRQLEVDEVLELELVEDEKVKDEPR